MAAKKRASDGSDGARVVPTKRVDPWDIYLRALRNGSTERAAAAMAGVSRGTIARWIDADEGKQVEEEAARQEYLDSLRGEVDYAARTKERDAWKAAAWLLERRDPDQWKQRTSSELTGAAGGPMRVEHDLADKSDDELIAMLRRLTEDE